MTVTSFLFRRNEKDILNLSAKHRINLMFFGRRHPPFAK